MKNNTTLSPTLLLNKKRISCLTKSRRAISKPGKTTTWPTTVTLGTY